MASNSPHFTCVVNWWISFGGVKCFVGDMNPVFNCYLIELRAKKELAQGPENHTDTRQVYGVYTWIYLL
jgi:hypothetical protein